MRIGLLSLALVVGMTNSLLSRAGDSEDLSDYVPQWVRDGKVIPLDVLMERHKVRLDGRLLDLEVERENGRIIYELEVLREDSVVYEIKIDAENGRWIEEEVED